MCGEMAGDAINIPVLLGLGLTNLSMNASAIPVIKKMIRSMNVSKARKDVQTILGFQTVQEIVGYIQKEYRDLLPYKDNEE